MAGMLRRMLMVLLIACLAAPAIAMPAHCMPEARPMAAMAHHGMSHGARHEAPVVQLRTHDCIGCIAPTAAVSAPPARAFAHKPLLSTREPPFRPLAPPAPETPPPRA